MTAQSTTQRPTTGIRVAPMLVVIIAIIAFATGLAIARVAAPATAAVAPQAAAPVSIHKVSPDGGLMSDLVADPAAGGAALAGTPAGTDRRAYDGLAGTSSREGSSDAWYPGRNR